MSFEYITEKNITKKLSDAELDALANRISNDFDTYNNQRRTNLDQANALINEIFFKKEKDRNGEDIESKTADDKYENWKSKVRMCKTFMFYQTLKAFIWKNIYANVNSMFDVAGENQESDNESTKQKAALVDVFEKMDFSQTCDKIINYAMLHGELISFSAWKKKSEEYRRSVAEDALNPKAIAAIAKGKFHFIDERPIYDNPYVYEVNPADLVFDVSQKNNWDDCPKIYKSYKVPDDIINNKYYKVDKEVAEALKSLVKNPDPTSSQMNEDLEEQIVNGGTIEVLEHWGNLRLTDGTLLKNWHCVVVARKYVVRFERNSRIVNPFTYDTFIEDPETGRGISPLYCILSLAKTQEDLLNRTCDMQTLQECPPIYAPTGFFDEEEIRLYPGKVIEFGDSLSPDKIKPMEFAISVFLNDITFLSDLMAEVSGIFPNMAGAEEKGNKTATEISTKAQGQLTRLSMMIDCINQGLIVPIVKKVAKLCADFKSGDEDVFVNRGNEKETIRINDNIRKGDYRYTYSDRTATTERSNKADLVINAAKEFAQFIPLNGQELFTWYMEQKDVENPERFLQVQQLLEPEVQESLMRNPQLAPIIQAMQTEIQAQKQGVNRQNNGQQEPVVVSDANNPQQANALE